MITRFVPHGTGTELAQFSAVGEGGKVHLWLFPVLIMTPFTTEAHRSAEPGSGGTEAEAWAQVEGDFRERHPGKGWRIARDEGKPAKVLFNLSADNPLLIERERLRLRAMAAGVRAQEAA